MQTYRKTTHDSYLVKLYIWVSFLKSLRRYNIFVDMVKYVNIYLI